MGTPSASSLHISRSIATTSGLDGKAGARRIVKIPASSLVRTFPKSLATFRKIVNERGERLREVAFEELQKLAAEPNEQLTVEARPATIGIIVQAMPSGGLRVVVQGFMKARFIPGMQHVALDGFYKYPDGTVAPMPSEEFYEFD